MVQNHWVAPKLNQLFILPRPINLVLGTPGDLMVKSKLSPRTGSVVLKQFNPIHKKRPKSFFFNLRMQLKKKIAIEYHAVISTK